ncbi:PIN domain-containing protein [Nocardioides dilutus]
MLDSEALSAVARTGTRAASTATAVNMLRAALLQEEEILVPAAVLAELYRGHPHDQVVDACLNRFPAIVVVDTDRALAREIGHVLARAGRGSADHVDASVVAVAARTGPALIATADAADITALAAGMRGVRVLQI